MSYVQRSGRNAGLPRYEARLRRRAMIPGCGFLRFRKKLSFPELRRAVIEQDRLYAPEAIVIEDRASGTQLIQDLIGDGLSHVARFSAAGDKIMRLNAETAVIENGFVFVPEEAPWLADYLAELLSFPAGRHDDQVDSTAQALAWARRPGPAAAGMLDYWRRLTHGGRG